MRLQGPRVVLETLVEADADALRAIRREPAVERWWDALEADFPMHDEEIERLTVHLGDEVIGMVQFDEELEPKYRSASIDIFMATAHHGRGLGTEVLRAVVAHLLDERGHHRITIDPAAHNIAAVKAYTRAGFRPVGVLRLAERDSDGRGWHDALMMELVREA